MIIVAAICVLAAFILPSCSGNQGGKGVGGKAAMGMQSYSKRNPDSFVATVWRGFTYLVKCAMKGGIPMLPAAIMVMNGTGARTGECEAKRKKREDDQVTNAIWMIVGAGVLHLIGGFWLSIPGGIVAYIAVSGGRQKQNGSGT